MPRLRARYLQNRLNVEIALARWAGPMQYASSASRDMQRIAVRVGVDGDGAHAKLLAGANHAHGDLAAIGDQDALKHRHVPTSRAAFPGRRECPPAPLG